MKIDTVIVCVRNKRTLTHANLKVKWYLFGSFIFKINNKHKTILSRSRLKKRAREGQVRVENQRVNLQVNKSTGESKREIQRAEGEVKTQ